MRLFANDLPTCHPHTRRTLDPNAKPPGAGMASRPGSRPERPMAVQVQLKWNGKDIDVDLQEDQTIADLKRVLNAETR